MNKKIYLLVLLLISGVNDIQAGDRDVLENLLDASNRPGSFFRRILHYNPSRSIWDIDPHGDPFAWRPAPEFEHVKSQKHEDLLDAVYRIDDERLRDLLSKECDQVETIFPEAKPRIKFLIQNISKEEYAVLSNALTMPSLLIKIIKDYKGPSDILDGYQLQEIVVQKCMQAEDCHSAKNLESSLPIGFFTVESEEPRSSLTLKSSGGKILLEEARDLEEEEINFFKKTKIMLRSWSRCIALLEQQPAQLMKAYIRLCTEED